MCTFLKPVWHNSPNTGTACTPAPSVLPSCSVWFSTSPFLPQSRTLGCYTPPSSVVAVAAKLPFRWVKAVGEEVCLRPVRKVKVEVLQAPGLPHGFSSANVTVTIMAGHAFGFPEAKWQQICLLKHRWERRRELPLGHSLKATQRLPPRCREAEQAPPQRCST